MNRPGRFGPSLLLIFCCAPAFAQASKYFTATDYSAETIVTVSNLPNQLNRQNQTNSPHQDALDGTIGASTDHAESNATLADAAKATASAASGRGVQAVGQTIILNKFVLVPKPGFTGTTARVTLGYHLTGQLNISCSDPSHCSWATGGAFAQILTTRMDADGRSAPRLDYTKTNITINRDPGSTTIDQQDGLQGVATVNLPVIVQMNVSSSAGALSDGDPINGYTSSSGSSNVHLGICATSPDPVTIYWASDLFSPVQPTEGCPKDVPSPGPDLGPGNVCDNTPAPNGSPAICGFADLHTHQFANLGFGGMVFRGEPFDPNGISAALAWCDFAPIFGVDPLGLPLPTSIHPGPNGGLEAMVAVHGPGGLADAIGVAMNQGFGHKVGGWPEFDGWPRWNSYDHQAMYVDWLYRAFQGGLKLMVMHAVNNDVFCKLSNQIEGYGCNDMNAVDRQIAAAKALEQYVDNQFGGPGQGWYRIVYTPQQARDAIAKGQLAVVLGIEVDYLFNCASSGNCTEADVRQGLAKYFDMGVRHIYPVHVFDNGFAGAAFYNDFLNFGNKVDSGKWFSEYDCSSDGFAFQLGHPTLVGDLIEHTLLGGTLFPPAYTGAGQCNTQGLTPLGNSLLKKSMSRKMIVEVDHMSKRSVDATLQFAAQLGYPMIGGHTGFLDVSIGAKRYEAQKTKEQLAAIYATGGMVGAITEQGTTAEIATTRASIPHDCGHSSKSWAQAYLYAVQQTGGAPVGLGSDFNGFAGEPAPRFGDDACAGDKQAPQTGGVGYPFSVIGGNGAKLDRSVTGNRTFDYNYDGLAHVGLLPDFIQDLRSMGLTDTDLKPLFRSAEGYIEMWEKIQSKNLFPPSVTVTPATAANSYGWYNAPVSLTLAATQSQDGWDLRTLTYSLSGAQTQPAMTLPEAAATSAASATVTVNQEGTTKVSFTASDSAANTAVPVVAQVMLDRTPPVVAWAGNAGSYTVDQTVTLTCSATDTLSGVASTTCANISKPAYSFAMGSNTVSASATDKAGNTASASATFSVKSTPAGLVNVLLLFLAQSNPQVPQLAQKYQAQIKLIENAIANASPQAKAALVDVFVKMVEKETGTVFTADQAAILVKLARAL